MSKDQWQKKANQNQNEKRLGSPYYSAVRLDDDEQKIWLDAIVASFPGTKKESLLAAYKLLEKELKK